MNVFLIRVALALSIVVSAEAPVQAAVLALAPTPQGNLHIVDTASGNSTVLEVASCCAVQAGSVTADTINHRAYFVANRTDGADLYVYRYDASPSVTSHPVSAGQRITHLAYDTAQNRLVGLAVTDAGAVEVITVAPNTGTVTVTGTLGAGCCTLREGVIAYVNSGTIYTVGRRSTDTNDQLFAISISGGALANVYDLGNERVSTLVANGSTLYALSYAQTSGVIRPGTFAFSPGFSFTPLGAGSSDCCFVLAGSGAIDHTKNTLVALTRSLSTAGPFVARSFSLSTGAITIGKALPAMGLFEDSATLFDRIFADSFE